MALPNVYRFFVDYENQTAYKAFGTTGTWSNLKFIQGDAAKCEFYLVKPSSVTGVPFEAVDFDGSATFSLKLGSLYGTATSTTSVSSTSSTAATVSTVVAGSSAANEIQQIVLSPAPAGGTFTVEYGGNYSTSISVNASASEFKTGLNAITALTDKTNITKVADYVWRIEFIGTLAKTNVNAVTVQTDGVRSLAGKVMTLDLTASGVTTLVGNAESVSAKLDFSWALSGETQTGFVLDCTVVNDI